MKFLKNTLMVASDRLRNVFARQIFTSQLKTWSSEQFLKYLPAFYSEKMSWKRGRQLKSCLSLVYFHFYSFATGMTYMSSNIFISNVLLKNPTERNA